MMYFIWLLLKLTAKRRSVQWLNREIHNLACITYSSFPGLLIIQAQLSVLMPPGHCWIFCLCYATKMFSCELFSHDFWPISEALMTGQTAAVWFIRYKKTYVLLCKNSSLLLLFLDAWSHLDGSNAKTCSSIWLTLLWLLVLKTGGITEILAILHSVEINGRILEIQNKRKECAVWKLWKISRRKRCHCHGFQWLISCPIYREKQAAINLFGQLVVCIQIDLLIRSISDQSKSLHQHQ